MRVNLTKKDKRKLRHARVRAKVFGTPQRPRLSVHKSNTQIRAQIIDDTNGQTLVYVESKNLDGKTKMEKAISAGKKIAELAKQKGISKVVFDRGGFSYQSSIKAFADSAREAGLEF